MSSGGLAMYLPGTLYQTAQDHVDWSKIYHKKAWESLKRAKSGTGTLLHEIWMQWSWYHLMLAAEYTEASKRMIPLLTDLQDL